MPDANQRGTDGSIYQQILALLDAESIAYRHVEHSPTRTSEESARARGEELRIGGKALLMKCGDDEFRLFVLPADRKIDSAAVRRELGIRKMRFATREELDELTGLVPGAVPPFGRPILPFDLYVDELLCANERIAFNAGSLTDSLILATEDYQRAAKADRVFSFSKE